MKKMSIEHVIKKYLIPIGIGILAFWDFNRGVDLTDAGYSIDYFTYFRSYEPDLIIASFWSYLIGHILTLLPYGRTWIGITFYATIFVALLAEFGYFFCKKYMDYRIAAVGEVFAIMYCWNPSTVVYDYLSFLLFEIGIILLMQGIYKDSWGFMLLAGMVLGFNVFVRVPNLAQCATIGVLWLYAIWNKKKILWTIKRTVVCVAGYVGILGVSVLVIIYRYGLLNFKIAMYNLVNLSTTQDSYGIGYMATETIRAVFRYWKYFSIRTYVEYVSDVLGATSIILLAGIFLSIAGIVFYKNTEKKLLNVIFLGVLWVTPLGSNNNMYLAMLNMFLLLPIIGMNLHELVCRILKKKKYLGRAAAGLCLLLVTILGSQILILETTYVYKDTPELKVTKPDSYLRGMWTSKAQHEELSQLEGYFEENGLKGTYGILYCGAPGLQVVLDLQPVMSSPWPDWYTYTDTSFENGIRTGEQLVSEHIYPVVIMSKTYYDIFEGNVPQEGVYAEMIDAKYYMIAKFLRDNAYSAVFQTKNYVVYYNIK